MTNKNAPATQRIVIFTHNHLLHVPATLIRATLAAVDADNRLELAAICTPKTMSFRRVLHRYIKARIRCSIRSLFDPDLKKNHQLPMLFNLRRNSRRFKFRILTPPDGNFNNPKFIAQLREEVRPTLALSFYCFQKLSPELLGVFTHAVNYHNGLLPDYQGLKATAWSVYHREKKTGFTFHYMTEKIDAGPILMQGAVPVYPESYPSELERQKTGEAVTQLPRLLDMIMAGHPGRPQQGRGRYFSMKDADSAMKIPYPSAISSEELNRTLQAFGCARIMIDGCFYSVTKIKQLPHLPGKRSRFCFKTSDGIWMKAVRLKRSKRQP